MGQIYKITNIINGLSYIGQTKYNAIYRFYAHLSTIKNTRFYNSIQKYGKDSFKLEILEDNVPIDKLDELEIYYIKKFNTFLNGYNETKGGSGIKSYKHSIKTKEKISKKVLEAYKNGKILSKNRNEKIKNALKGVQKSIEHRQKLSENAKKRVGALNGFYGRHHTTETKAKISNKNSIKVDMFTIDNHYMYTFKNAKIAAYFLINFLKLNLKHESVYRQINWHCMSNKPYKNFIWKYNKEV